MRENNNQPTIRPQSNHNISIKKRGAHAYNKKK